MENEEIFSPENVAGDNFAVEELLNLTDTDDGESFSGVAVKTSDSSVSGGEIPILRDIAETQISDELCVPYDDIAELEWLSNFVEDSFSSQDLQNLNIISGTKLPFELGSETHSSNTDPNQNPTRLQSEPSIPVKSCTKRPNADPMSPKPKKKREVVTDGRRCLHCDTDKTPQWRTGPMGPKTLCNACGVRYKSGRLVPEYRPVASPTFVTAKHSNSHRKVMELRRHKEAREWAHQMFDGSDSDNYLIHKRMGPDFRHLI